MLDRRHNLVVVTEALMSLEAVLVAKLADAINRALGMVLSGDSERVLASLLACRSERGMRETLARMHCGSLSLGDMGDVRAGALDCDSLSESEVVFWFLTGLFVTGCVCV